MGTQSTWGSISWKEAQLLLTKMAHLKLLLLLVPGILGQTQFKKCTTFGSDLCFEAKIKEIVVKIGEKGTNDDVTVEFCPDTDTKQCCTTPVLSSLLSDDWSSKDTETWKAKKFGNCKDKVYKIKKEMLVTVSKSGTKDRLLVDLIDVYLVSPDKKKDKDILERFQCKNYDIGGSKLPKQTVKCQTGPYHYQQIEKAIFQIDKGGTDNDVSFKIASDANNVTCQKQSSHTFSDDWRKNKLETWLRSDFGNCKDKLYKINNAPTFSIVKTGKDDLKVRTSTFYMRRLDNDQTTKYDCGPFEIKGDCNKLVCTHTFSNCKKSTVAGIGGVTPKTSAGRTTKKPATTTTTAATTTKKKGLLSSLLG